MWICRAERSVWVSFTGERQVEPTRLRLLVAERMPTEGCVAFGEPHHGHSGWELSHRQAAAALAVGLRRNDRMSWMQDLGQGTRTTPSW